MPRTCRHISARLCTLRPALPESDCCVSAPNFDVRTKRAVGSNPVTPDQELPIAGPDTQRAHRTTSELGCGQATDSRPNRRSGAGGCHEPTASYLTLCGRRCPPLDARDPPFWRIWVCPRCPPGGTPNGYSARGSAGSELSICAC